MMPAVNGRASCLPLVLMVSLWTGVASADPATAEALFREGRTLLDKGNIDQACVKLGESQAQDASSGTLLNLALCHERQGKLATAWAEYAAAARLSNAQGRPERAEVANRRAAELDPRLARIVINAEAPLPPDLRIKRGTETVGLGTLGTTVPVDAGTHLVSASAAGYRSWSMPLTVVDGETKTVEVPALEPETPIEPTATEPARAVFDRPTAPRESDTRGGTPSTGWWIGGVGVVALGIGAGFGLASLASYSSAEKQCPTKRDCSSDAQTARNRAETQAWVADVALGLGLVGVALGTYVILTSKSDDPPAKTSIRVAPRGDGASLVLVRSF
jgi:tetratricopeptide (TPR) repeat protein